MVCAQVYLWLFSCVALWYICLQLNSTEIVYILYVYSGCVFLKHIWSVSHWVIIVVITILCYYFLNMCIFICIILYITYTAIHTYIHLFCCCMYECMYVLSCIWLCSFIVIFIINICFAFGFPSKIALTVIEILL